MKLKIDHTTDYRYSEPLTYALQQLWLTPLSGPAQTVDFWSVGAPEKLFAQIDAFGNPLHSYTFVATPASNVRWSLVNAQGQVQTQAIAQFQDSVDALPPAFYLRPTQLAAPHAELTAFAQRAGWEPGVAAPLRLGMILALATAIKGAVSYKKYSTTVTTTALEAFRAGSGVCQDQAHVMIAVCRSVGIPARYVSGYFYAANEPDLASHAWADVCIDLEAREWVSIDVTHACVTDERHIRLAIGTDYNSCPPIKGVRRGGGDERMTVKITIAPV